MSHVFFLLQPVVSIIPATCNTCHPSRVLWHCLRLSSDLRHGPFWGSHLPPVWGCSIKWFWDIYRYSKPQQQSIIIRLIRYIYIFSMILLFCLYFNIHHPCFCPLWIPYLVSHRDSVLKTSHDMLHLPKVWFASPASRHWSKLLLLSRSLDDNN